VSGSNPSQPHIEIVVRKHSKKSDTDQSEEINKSQAKDQGKTSDNPERQSVEKVKEGSQPIEVK
jgi:hypothetical protein